MIALEVRHATLNTHDPHMIAVEEEEKEEKEEKEEEEEEEEEKTHIKSNNPHLTGREKTNGEGCLCFHFHSQIAIS